MKRCRTCGETKALAEFGIQNKRYGYLRLDCLICHRANARAGMAALRAANPEKYRAYAAQWRKENPDIKRAYDQKDYAKNLEAKRAAARERYRRNREQHLKKHQEWRKAHPKERVESNTAAGARRRARATESGGSWTAEQWRVLKASYDFQCLMCHRREPDITLCADHVIPIAKGGTSDISNIQPLCKSCNSSKGTRILDLRQ